MSITNLLARGFDPMPAGGQANALMQVQQLRAGQQRNLLMQQQVAASQAEMAQAQKNALMQQQWRDSLKVPQGTSVQIPGLPAMNAAQAESAARLPGYGVSSAQDRTEFVPPDPRQVAAVQMAKAGMMSPTDLFKIQNPERKLTSVKEGETLIDERTMKPVFSGAPKAEKPPSAVQEYQFAVGQGYKGTFEQWDTARKKAGATNVSIAAGQKGYDNESKLRNDFKAEPIYKDYVEMATAYKQIKAGLNAKTPIGDVAAATKVMKLLDPGSVVRESELAIAMAAAGKLDRLQNYLQMKISGETLTPTQRSDFGALAQELFEAAGDAYNNKRKEYADMGARYGLGDAALGGAHVSTRGATKPAAAAGKLSADEAAELKALRERFKVGGQ